MTSGSDSSAHDSDRGTAPANAAGSTRRELSLDEYLDGIRAGELAVVARAVTLVESRLPRHQQLADQLLSRLPSGPVAMRVGITGIPGAGKSTFIDALGLQLLQTGHRVAVLAVDPSSELSGGSVLADKTRMGRLAAQPAAFIRPSPSGGSLGGVARRTRESMLVCEAAGFDVILVETVGVGQSESLVADMTDSFLALLVPGTGDELQGIKRGLLELVDVIAVNKCDGALREAAEQAAQQYRLALSTLAGRQPAVAPRVLTCSALNGDGVEEVWAALEAQHHGLRDSGRLDERRRRQSLRWMWHAIDERLRDAVRAHPAVAALRSQIEAEVCNGERTADAAARAILEAFLTDPRLPVAQDRDSMEE